MPQQERGQISVRASKQWVANLPTAVMDSDPGLQTGPLLQWEPVTSPSMLRFCLRMEMDTTPATIGAHDNTSSQKEHHRQIPLQLHPMSSSHQMETLRRPIRSQLVTPFRMLMEIRKDRPKFVGSSTVIQLLHTTMRRRLEGLQPPLVKSGPLKSFLMMGPISVLLNKALIL